MKSHATPDKGAEAPKGTGEAIQLKAQGQSNWFNQLNAFGNPRTAGLPTYLQNSLENRTGIAMDDVSVHYNSSDPAQLDALAYAAGTNIYLGPGQEKYLPHEAWHVVQQKSGLVQPTGEVGGRSVNDDPRLEREADTWLQSSLSVDRAPSEASEISQTDVVQRTKGNWTLGGALGLAGAAAAYWLPGYWKLLGLPLAALGAYLAMDHETAGERAIRERLENNDFRIGAGMKQYSDSFGEGFLDDLGRLNGAQRWMDGGAGSAVAIRDYYGDNSHGKAQTIAVGYNKPQSETVARLEQDSKFRYASGKFFGAMDPDRDLGLQEEGDDLNLITDYNGVLTYTKTLSEDLQKYLDLLAVGGVIYLWLFTTIEPYGGPESERGWLEETQGVEVTRLQPHTYKIQKTDRNARVQPLQNIRYEEKKGEKPPVRIFRAT